MILRVERTRGWKKVTNVDDGVDFVDSSHSKVYKEAAFTGHKL